MKRRLTGTAPCGLKSTYQKKAAVMLKRLSILNFLQDREAPIIASNALLAKKEKFNTKLNQFSKKPETIMKKSSLTEIDDS